MLLATGIAAIELDQLHTVEALLSVTLVGVIIAAVFILPFKSVEGFSEMPHKGKAQYAISGLASGCEGSASPSSPYSETNGHTRAIYRQQASLDVNHVMQRVSKIGLKWRLS